MASRTKKKEAVVSESVTFKKEELVKKLEKFLEENNACNGDWLNKARIAFLGEKTVSVGVDALVPAFVEVEFTCDGPPTKERVAEALLRQLKSGEVGFDFADLEFKVEKFKVNA
jgi:hypothetical protein